MLTLAAAIVGTLLVTESGIETPSNLATGSTMGSAQIVLTPVATGLSDPILVTNARDGSHRLFIVELSGIIKVLQPGASTPSVFLDIRSRVIAGGELGLLGLTFHPQYQTNRRFFVHYSRITDAATVIAEYKVSAANPNVAELAETVLLVITGTQSNHNGGMIEFGPDGYLYIGLGDGGFNYDPDNRAQDIEDLNGKILRIDVDHTNGSIPYSSPSDNPFYGNLRGRDEIYTHGMRNPWRFSFDRGTGALWIGDVGEGQREEVNIGQLGGNYGWRIYEGTACTGLDFQLCTPPGFTFPLAEYSHTGGRCSISGGYVYRGFRSSLPTGAYVYGDFCTGEIFILQGTTQTLLLDTSLNISSFGEDESGEIYVVGLGGTVSRITNPNAPAPRNKPADFDSDGRVDLSVFRAGVWYIKQSLNGAFRAHYLGTNSDRIAPGDFDGDGRTDIGVLEPGTGIWRILQSSNNSLFTQSFGTSGDSPVARDYDGDGKTDLAVFRPGINVWFILQSAGNTLRAVQFGNSTDKPVPADYDGDGKTDIAVYRDGVWYILRSSNNILLAYQFGLAMDRPVPSDYDGDGSADIAVFRATTGTWYLLQSSQGFRALPFGLATDEPVPGDYDGDNKSDAAVFRNGTWYVFESASATLRSEHFGNSGDVPVPSAYLR